MFILYFIGVYIVVVIAVALSHLFLPTVLKYDERKSEKQKLFWKMIRNNCEEKNNFKLKKSVIKKLKQPSMLAAFFEVSVHSSGEVFGKIMEENKQQLIELGRTYKRSTMRAYFAYILCSLKPETKGVRLGFEELMVEYTINGSVYCRENALKYLYQYGSAEEIYKVFYELSRRGIFHSEKLLTDGLMTYHGTANEFVDAIRGYFDNLMPCYQVAIVNYFSYKDEHDFDKDLMDYIELPEAETNVICAVLRCIGRVSCEENKQKLLSELEKFNDENGWEAAAVAANVLGSYTGDDEVRRALERSLKSKHWYVRMNSAKSIVQVGVTKEEKRSLLESDDNYAKNALLYSMEANA